MAAFEDSGFYCVDNMPVALLPKFLELPIESETEITGIAYMHRDGDVRPDTVGIALPETECKISEEGEILSRSPSVTPGYYEMPKRPKNCSKTDGCTPVMPDILTKTDIWW